MTMMKALWGLMVLLIIGVLIAFMTWGVPAPSARVEQTIPNDRLPQ